MKVWFKVVGEPDVLFEWQGPSMLSFNRIRRNPDRPVQATKVGYNNMTFVAPEWISYWWEAQQ